MIKISWQRIVKSKRFKRAAREQKARNAGAADQKKKEVRNEDQTKTD